VATDREQPGLGADVVAELERLAETKSISSDEFWALVARGDVMEAMAISWSEKQLLVRKKDSTFVAVKDGFNVEDFRDRLISEGVPFRMLDDKVEISSEGSEGAVASGLGVAVAVGIADALVELTVPLAAPVITSGTELEVQSLFDNESPQAALSKDMALIDKDLRVLERAAEADFEMVKKMATSDQVFGGFFSSAAKYIEDVTTGLFTNHAPDLGGLIEDSYMALLVAVSLFSLYQMFQLRRKANSFSGLMHTATGAMQIVTVLYAIVEERCLRESPGPIWAVFTFVVFMVNNITMWPLLKYFRGPEVQRVLFKLAYSFIISFQGIHAIAWSIQYPWLYWVVMPFWFYSIKKLFESSDNIFALLPDGSIPIDGVQEAAKRRVKGIVNDTPTIVYSTLNFAGAVFDNLYMAVYTWRGPAGFWGWSAENIPGINDHLRTGLVKPAFGSLTISVLVFVGTLYYRKKISLNTAIALNVVLASVGPWLILYYHKLVDWSEPWQPEIMGDWGSKPYFLDHLGDLPGLLAMPLALLGAKVLTAGSVAPAVAEGLPDGSKEMMEELASLPSVTTAWVD